eukprot:gene24890-30345_t
MPMLKHAAHPQVQCMKRHGVIPIIVFDGDRLPAKAQTLDKRSFSRQENLAKAKEYEAEGNTSQAEVYYQRGVRVTPDMSAALIQALKQEGTEFLVAPYEADAQMAALSSMPQDVGGVAAVVTEDGDLLCYRGVKTVLFKLNKCVLAGCDFLESVKNMGMKTAKMYVSKYRNLDRVLRMMKQDKKLKVPNDYAENFKKAMATFHHARDRSPSPEAVAPSASWKRPRDVTASGGLRPAEQDLEERGLSNPFDTAGQSHEVDKRKASRISELFTRREHKL